MRWLAFGALLALTVLTRVAGAALVIAFAVHAAWRWGRAPRRGLVPLAFSVLPVIALTLLWIALRPHGAPDNYQSIGAKLYRAWLGQPAANAGYAWRVLVDSWIASFTAQGDVGPTARAVLEGLGIVALAGAVRAAMRNRLDGWYVLASIAITYFWVFGEDNTRRLLYPLVPLALVHAAQIVLAMARAVPAPRLRPVIVGAVALVPAAVCLPAMMLLADKARERAPVIAGSHYRYADIVEFYTVIRRERARAEAGHTLAVLAGLEALAHVTPPEAKVMWIRPEYVAILGGRDAEPYLLSWDAARRDREVLERRVDYIVRSWVYKTDLDGVKADAVKFLAGVERYCETVMRIDNPAADYRAFELLKVDRAKLAERVAAESR